ncbi:T9SS type A sorting domain-containing protein [Hymenobacter arizonensis]|uniref:Por secretion system C-terminal sorting domain-containing protein n=1 Tax=Hymenobacter arizonensis TaxID=1227077 RepID=A0A1I5XZY9_HYMAR|nr:T9SS type A sorting domain-containing protein [Hymenobacter arizonensis]SFQ37505.1 Por secretion system C-terminal sorting domain-containing protein [Hymenobacter arizonensis]
MRFFTQCLVFLLLPLAVALAAPANATQGTPAPAAAPTTTPDTRASITFLNVYPNPSRGQITVQLTQRTTGDYKFRLSNIIGQELRTIALKPELASAGLPVDLSDFRAGMYFYSLLVDGKVVTTKRLVLQN